MDPMGFYEVDNFVDYCEQEHKGNYETAFADWRIASERRKAERRASYNWMPWNLLKVRTSLNYPWFCLVRSLLQMVLMSTGSLIKISDLLYTLFSTHLLSTH